MPDIATVLVGLSGWLAWLSKEIISALLKRSLARSGAIGVLDHVARVCCDMELPDGSARVVPFRSFNADERTFGDGRRFRIEFESQLFNDKDTQIVLAKFELQFWGVEGPTLLWKKPRAFLRDPSGQWQPTSSLPIPAHSAVGLKFEIPLPMGFHHAIGELQRTYTRKVVLLTAEAIDGRKGQFRICTTSFWGEHVVVWPDRLRYPIFNEYDLNRDGRQAGRRPQSGAVTQSRRSSATSAPRNRGVEIDHG